MNGAAALMFALVATPLAASALLTGPSLNDDWTLFLADPARPFGQTLALWSEDMCPPIFDTWATLLSAVGITSIPFVRLISNLPGGGGQREVPAGPCPTVIWMEQSPGQTHPTLAQLLDASTLRGLEKARLKAFRTDSGILLIAER